MNVRVLGCHGSGELIPGANGPIQCGTCGFLVNGQLLVDAGTIGSRLFLDEQRRIRVVLLTHLHFDHTRELPTLADNLVGEIDEPVVIAAIPEVLDGQRAHIFNGTVYPDFFRLPDPARPVFVPYESRAGREDLLYGMGVTPIRVNHVVPTVGFFLREGILGRSQQQIAELYGHGVLGKWKDQQGRRPPSDWDGQSGAILRR